MKIKKQTVINRTSEKPARTVIKDIANSHNSYGVSDDGELEVYAKDKHDNVYRIFFSPYEILAMAAFMISTATFKKARKK